MNLEFPYEFGFPLGIWIFLVNLVFPCEFGNPFRISNNSPFGNSTYSVMQSDGNSFGGDVVLKNVNIASSYEDSILDQIYE